MPKLQIACNTAVTDGMVVQHAEREGGPGPPHHPRVPARQPPDRLPGVRPGRRVLPAGPVHGARPPRLARSSPRRRSRSARWWTSGPIMLDAERCVLCSRCLRFEASVTGTNSFEFGTAATTPRSRPSRTGPSPTTTPATWPTSARWARCSPTTSASRCASGSWRSTESVCPGCSTGCNIFVDHRDGEVQRLRPRRNVEVNRSWMCDIGRMEYKEIALDTRLASPARARGERRGLARPAAGRGPRRASHAKLAGGGRAPRAFLATPQATNEDLYAFRLLAEQVGRDARLPRRATRRTACTCARTTSSCAPTATPTRRAASTWASARRAWTRSWRPAAPGEVKVLAAAGPGAAAPARGGGRPGAGALHRRDGDPRRPRARPRARRAAGRGVGRGGRAPSPTTSAACSASAARCPPPARPLRAGSWPPACCSRLGAPAAATSARELFAGAGPRGARLSGLDHARWSAPRAALLPSDGPAPPGGEGLMAATRVVTVDRNTKPGIGPILPGWPSPSRTW